MSQEKISGGVVHQVPADLKKALHSCPNYDLKTDAKKG
jgi:hypothetical protein